MLPPPHLSFLLWLLLVHFILLPHQMLDPHACQASILKDPPNSIKGLPTVSRFVLPSVPETREISHIPGKSTSLVKDGKLILQAVFFLSSLWPW